MTDEVVIRRLLLTLWGGRQEVAALEHCVTLAARMEAELATLFVEDEQLLRAGRLPFALEVGRTSARVRALSESGIETSLRAAAEHARRTLEEVAGRSALPFTFEVVRGQPVAAALSVSHEVDAVLFACGGRGRARISATAGAIPIFAMLPPGKPAIRWASTVMRLAHGVGAEMILGLTAADVDEFARLRAEIESTFAPGRPHPRFLRLTGSDVSAVVRGARSVSATMVVAPTLLTPAEVTAMIGGLDCPLLLLDGPG